MNCIMPTYSKGEKDSLETRTCMCADDIALPILPTMAIKKSSYK